MENIIVGIDVSKDRLDVAVRPSGENFVVRAMRPAWRSFPQDWRS
jgi:hypothetical protein